ncbi:uncharacterized protein LTR77_010520 [Saxophila tyrrhenica]|uniref:DUF7918 domain-containing protein n=1 Tax=Saxophila tyrrhenica TaxID=1690608 RepID=A0AAV9NVK0_9PEZI|nr:hypothetical protein LTR77_010520 [Saxophila tyrrhenica]
MLDPTTGIEVYVRPWRALDPYPEYEHPTHLPPLAEGENKNARYLEAVTDERFEIQVTIPASAPLHEEKCFGILVFFEGMRRTIEHCLPGREKHPNQPYTCTADKLAMFDGTSLTFNAMVFGALTAATNRRLSADEEEDELNNRGRIEVMIYRGTLYLGKPFEEDEDLFPTVTSPKVLKERSHSLKLIELRTDRRWPLATHFTPDDGENSKVAGFKFFYGSYNRRRMFDDRSVFNGRVETLGKDGIMRESNSPPQTRLAYCDPSPSVAFSASTTSRNSLDRGKVDGQIRGLPEPAMPPGHMSSLATKADGLSVSARFDKIRPASSPVPECLVSEDAAALRHSAPSQATIPRSNNPDNLSESTSSGAQPGSSPQLPFKHAEAEPAEAKPAEMRTEQPEITAEPARKKIKVEVVDLTADDTDPPSTQPVKSEVPSSDRAARLAVLEKEKKRLLLRQEEKQIMRRLMDLEDGTA